MTMYFRDADGRLMAREPGGLIRLAEPGESGETIDDLESRPSCVHRTREASRRPDADNPE